MTITHALTHDDPSVRLRAAMTIGVTDDPTIVDALVARCAVEPDFFVRDMLTWALCRLPAALTVPRLRTELQSTVPQARSQALHTLSKIGSGAAWADVVDLVDDPDDDVARTAWRASVALAPESESANLAGALARHLGRGSIEVRRSLSRTLADLGEHGRSATEPFLAHSNPSVSEHAGATIALIDDPDSGFADSLDIARRVSVTGTG